MFCSTSLLGDHIYYTAAKTKIHVHANVYTDKNIFIQDDRC